MIEGILKHDTVLVVEDERHLADLYTDHLSESYAVRTAYSGEEALEMLSEEIDVVLLERRMPFVSSNEVLAAIEDTDYDCRVGMVTATDPDPDVVDLGVDDYLVKPVDEGDLLDLIDRLLTMSEYNECRQELSSKKLERNVLEVETPREELEASDRYRELQTEIEQLESTLEDLSRDLSEEQRMRHR